MKKLLSILLVFTLFAVLPSCGDDNDNGAVENKSIVGTWKWSGADEYELLTFKKNGTYTFVEYDTDDNRVEDTYSGTYTLNDEILTVVVDGDVEVWTILNLTSNVLTMRYEGEYVGEYLNWEEGTDIMTYIRVE